MKTGSEQTDLGVVCVCVVMTDESLLYITYSYVTLALPYITKYNLFDVHTRMAI